MKRIKGEKWANAGRHKKLSNESCTKTTLSKLNTKKVVPLNFHPLGSSPNINIVNYLFRIFIQTLSDLL